jgi:hypothetical protein
MRSFFIGFLVVVGLVVVGRDTAEACSCASFGWANYAQEAKHVYLVRAGTPKTGAKRKQTYTVLATFKGTPRAQWVLDQPDSPCGTAHPDKAIAILFTDGKQLDLCDGNFNFEAQVAGFLEILKGAGVKQEPAKADALEAALREVLPKYLHDRPQITIKHDSTLAGSSFTIGKSRLTYAKTGTDKDIAIASAITAGNVTYVKGTYGTEGIQFTVVLHRDKAWKSIASWVAETKS